MLELLIIAGLGIAGSISYMSISSAERDSKNKAIKNNKRFWTDSKGRQINTITGKPMTIREVIGDSPKREIKRKKLCYIIYNERETSIIDIRYHGAKPIAKFEKYEEAKEYVKKIENESNNKGILEIDEIWM